MFSNSLHEDRIQVEGANFLMSILCKWNSEVEKKKHIYRRAFRFLRAYRGKERICKGLFTIVLLHGIQVWIPRTSNMAKGPSDICFFFWFLFSINSAHLYNITLLWKSNYLVCSSGFSFNDKTVDYIIRVCIEISSLKWLALSAVEYLCVLMN